VRCYEWSVLTSNKRPQIVEFLKALTNHRVRYGAFRPSVNLPAGRLQREPGRRAYARRITWRFGRSRRPLCTRVGGGTARQRAFVTGRNAQAGSKRVE
jgi:hypothetical protein